MALGDAEPQRRWRLPRVVLLIRSLSEVLGLASWACLSGCDCNRISKRLGKNPHSSQPDNIPALRGAEAPLFHGCGGNTAELRSADGRERPSPHLTRPHTRLVPHLTRPPTGSLPCGEWFAADGCVDGVEDFQAVDAGHATYCDWIADVYDLAIFVCERWPRGKVWGVGIA